jgi:hypothetical protein
MTTISVLGGDFEILFDDETVGANAVAGMRMVRRATGASATVYTTLQLYSDVAANADAFQAMGFTNPMLPTTPNEFTMENKYFIPRRSTEWLKEGTIKANWSLTASPDNNGNGVIRKPYTVVTNFVDGDIGRQVTESASGDTGTLLDFEQEPDGQWVAWIRPDDSTPTTGDIFDSTTGTISVTGDTGTGSNNVTIAGSAGQTQYTAFQAIGSVPTSTEVYVYQNRQKVSDYLGNFQWWTTDPTVSLGIISILLRTQAAGTTVADGDVEVFARRYTSLYDNFRLNVAAGGFAALPLASAPDINNTTGYSTFTGSSGSGTFEAGEEITEAVSGATGVVTAVGGSVASPVLEYYLVGDLTDIFSSGAQTVTGGTSGATCTSAAPTANADGPTETGAGNGATVTIALGHTTSDHDGNGTPEAYSVTVDAQGPGANGVPVATVYEVIKYRTRRGATTTDLFGVGVNVPGESYRGAEAVIFYDNPVGTLTEGDDLVTDPAGQWSSRLLADNATAAGDGVTQDYIMVTDQQTSLGTLADNDVIDDESGDSVTVDTTVGTGGPIQNFTSPKASPFGTFTGSQLFGARGVLYTGQADADTQAYTLTDDLGELRVSPNTVTYQVTNTVSGDVVYAARDTGVAGIIDKDKYGGLATPAAGYNEIGDFFIRVAGNISTDPEIPDVAWVRIIENTLQQEHHYVYDALDNTNEEFDLRTGSSYTGTATAGTSDTVLEDTGQTFQTQNVEVGMLVHVAGRSSTYEVTAVTDEDTLAISLLYGAGGFVSTDTYTINALIQTYANTDDVHDLILDTVATGTSVSNTFIKTLASDFTTVCNVRNGKNILPFTINQNVNDNGASITTVRQPDTIAV